MLLIGNLNNVVQVFIYLFLPSSFIAECAATDFPASLKLNALQKFLSYEDEIIWIYIYPQFFFVSWRRLFHPVWFDSNVLMSQNMSTRKFILPMY